VSTAVLLLSAPPRRGGWRWNEADNVFPLARLRLSVDSAELLNHFAKACEPPAEVRGTNEKKSWHGLSALDSLASEVTHRALILRDEDSFFIRGKGEDRSVFGGS